MWNEHQKKKTRTYLAGRWIGAEKNSSNQTMILVQCLFAQFFLPRIQRVVLYLRRNLFRIVGERIVNGKVILLEQKISSSYCCALLSSWRGPIFLSDRRNLARIVRATLLSIGVFSQCWTIAQSSLEKCAIIFLNVHEWWRKQTTGHSLWWHWAHFSSSFCFRLALPSIQSVRSSLTRKLNQKKTIC